MNHLLIIVHWSINDRHSIFCSTAGVPLEKPSNIAFLVAYDYRGKQKQPLSSLHPCHLLVSDLEWLEISSLSALYSSLACLSTSPFKLYPPYYTSPHSTCFQIKRTDSPGLWKTRSKGKPSSLSFLTTAASPASQPHSCNKMPKTKISDPGNKKWR